MSAGGDGGGTVAARARAVLLEADPRAKLMAARALARDWRRGRVAWTFDVAPPDRPARAERPPLLPPARMPKRRAGGPAGRIALLHAVAHIELGAIDLALDMAARFGAGFPRRFTGDWLGVAAEEAMHFAILARRLRALGSGYGALPAHAGMWEAAGRTAHDPLARLAAVPLVLEARGLDVTPPMIARLAAAGDHASARLLRRIQADEVGHVAIGMRWFAWGCAAAGRMPEPTWRALVDAYVPGALKPPFNVSARDAAGLSQSYYAQLATPVPAEHG